MTEKESPLQRFDRGLLAAVRVAVALLLAMMFVVIMWEVVARYVLASPAFWTEEFARYVMFYLVLVGSSVAIRQEAHPALRLITGKFGERLRFLWRLLLDILIVIVLLMILVKGISMAVDEWIGRTPALRVRFFWVYLALPIGALLMMVQIVTKYVFGKAVPEEAGEEVLE